MTNKGYSKVVFIIGPSGVGKNFIANYLISELDYLLIDIDVKHHFDVYDLKSQWKDSKSSKFVDDIEKMFTAKNLQGAIISLPSTKLLTAVEVQELNSVDAKTVLLWGQKDYCINSRKIRDKRNQKKFNLRKYNQKNDECFSRYGLPEFDKVRVDVFNSDGTFRDYRDILEDVMKLL